MADNLKVLVKKVEKYYNSECWKKAEHFIKLALKISPGDHWLLTRLASTYYEQHEYKKSLKIGKRALKLAPRCPLVLWDYAGTLDMLGHTKEALNIYKKLIKRGVSSIAYGECGEGIRWAKSLLNDCFYRIAKCYKKLGSKSKALEFYKRHLKSRKPGVSSIYSLKEVRRERGTFPKVTP